MGFFIDIFVFFVLYLILIISMNFFVGKTGIPFVGHIAFFAIGSYTTAIFTSIYHISPILAMLIGVGFSLLFSLLIGVITIRLSGHYLLISSLGITEIIHSLVNNSEITGGAEGMIVEPFFLPFIIFSAKIDLSLIIIIILTVEILYFHLFDKSKKGRLIKMMRDDYFLLISYGKSIHRLKIESFLLTVFWSSIAGSLYAHYSRYIDPSTYTIEETLMLFIAILIGGINSIRGSVFAAFIIIIIPEFMRFIQLPPSIISPLHQIFFAISVMIILIINPKGVFGKYLIK